MSRKQKHEIYFLRPVPAAVHPSGGREPVTISCVSIILNADILLYGVTFIFLLSSLI